MLESLLCNGCGAPLEVPESANFVKCNHCQTQLAVRRNESSTFTESIDKLNATTESLAEQVTRLTRQQELAVLDREWEIERANYMITNNETGRSSVPTEGGAMIGGIVATVFGVLWMLFAIGITSGGPSGASLFPLFGLLFIGVGIYSAINAGNKAHDYKRALARYKSKRAKLESATESGRD